MSAILRGLEERAAAGRPIRVGLVGAGFAGRGFAARIVRRTPGMELVAISNRTIGEAARAYRNGGVEAPVQVESARALESAIAGGQPAITDDPTVLTDAVGIDAIVDATGNVEFGAANAVRSIEAGKHLILVNSELDSVLGPLLKHRADAAGVVMTDMAGDQPAVIMDLIDEVRLLGFRPLLGGNVKSLLDHRRTPDTQRAFAEATGQRPRPVTSFVDGTKIAAEMVVLSNATGFGVARRGMIGPRADRVEEAASKFDVDALLERPIVDYILGAEPSFAVFVLAYEDDPVAREYMQSYRMGPGPVYTFVRPFHIGPLETVQSIARAVLLGDPAITPIGAPVTEVVALAKRPLRTSETLDGIGGFTVYGMIEDSDVARAERLLPMGLTDGAVLSRDVDIDAALTFDDVALPPDRIAERLWREQAALFGQSVSAVSAGA